MANRAIPRAVDEADIVRRYLAGHPINSLGINSTRLYYILARRGVRSNRRNERWWPEARFLRHELGLEVSEIAVRCRKSIGAVVNALRTTPREKR